MTKIENITLTINDNIRDKKKGTWFECDDFIINVKGKGDHMTVGEFVQEVLDIKFKQGKYTEDKAKESNAKQ